MTQATPVTSTTGGVGSSVNLSSSTPIRISSGSFHGVHNQSAGGGSGDASLIAGGINVSHSSSVPTSNTVGTQQHHPGHLQMQSSTQMGASNLSLGGSSVAGGGGGGSSTPPNSAGLRQTGKF